VETLTFAVRLIARTDGMRSFARKVPLEICDSTIRATRSYSKGACDDTASCR
jgi:hypothetical protein